MDQFLLPRRFQRGITHPWEGSGSMYSQILGQEEIHSKHMRENRFMVLLYSVVPSLASLAPERQLLSFSFSFQDLSNIGQLIWHFR